MSKRRWSVAKVIAAWHGPLTVDQIARQSGRGTSRTINNIWSRARDRGDLPQGQRPHFRTTAKIASPPSAARRDVLTVASVAPAPRWPACVADALLHFAGLPESERLETAEVVLAALIVSDPNNEHLRLTRADLSALRVAAHIRKHIGGDKPLPLVAVHSDGVDGDRRALGGFADACPVHLRDPGGSL